MIRLSDLAVARGLNRVVDSLTVEICAGSIYWIVGENGSGKSSLLRTLVGLDPPRRGAVERFLPPGWPLLYFQSEMSLPPASTVGDWERLVERLATSAGWDARTSLWPPMPRSRRVGKLSTGERKRLLLDALLRQPGSVVLDEPFAHLSPEARSHLRALLDARARDHVVIVATNQGTHRARDDGGLLLEAGSATPLGAVDPGPETRPETRPETPPGVQP